MAEDGLVEAFGEAVAALARFGRVKRVTWPRAARHRAFAGAVRDWLDETGRAPAR